MQEQVEVQRIPVKVYRSEERVMVAAPMPGLEPEDIRVEVTGDGSLVLHGDLRGTLKGEKEVLADEWNVGPYHRLVALPSAVDGKLGNVTYRNGVLVVVLPAAEQTRPAELRLEAAGPAHGERVAHTGHPAAGEERVMSDE